MRALLAPVVFAAALAGCAQEKQVFVDQAWVRLAAVPGRPAAAYFRLHGGPADTTLIAVASPVAIRAELHETMAEGPTMKMRAVDKVALPAGTTVAFAPAGKHVMLFDLSPTIKPGGGVPMRFTFADGLQIEYTAKAIAAGDPPPKF